MVHRYPEFFTDGGTKMARATNLTLVQRRSPADEMALAIEGFLHSRKAMNCSPNTIVYYKNRFLAFTRFLQAHNLTLAPWEVTPRIIRDFLTEQAEEKSPSTAHHSRLTLSAFFNDLLRDGVVESNPLATVERVRQRSTVIETFTQEHITALLATCGNDFPGVRDKAIMLLLLDSGLRASELCGLKLADIDWNGQTLRVLGKGNKERIVPFGMTAKQALLNYQARRGNLPTLSLFVTVYTVALNRYRLREIIIDRTTRAKISGIRCSPHTFRHTCAVMYLRNGGDVFSLQKLLGHTDLTMTRRYAELSQQDVIQKHRQFSPGDALPQQQTGGRKRLK